MERIGWNESAACAHVLLMNLIKFVGGYSGVTACLDDAFTFKKIKKIMTNSLLLVTKLFKSSQLLLLHLFRKKYEVYELQLQRLLVSNKLENYSVSFSVALSKLSCGRSI